MFLDYLYFVFIIPPFLLALYAQAKVKGNYSKFSKVRNKRGITGAQAAQMVLQSQGVNAVIDSPGEPRSKDVVCIEAVSGSLSDHYDPRTNVIRLSQEVYNSDSVSAVGIAAHEAGHAVQHAKNYMPNKIRSALVPLVNLGSNFSFILIFMGLMLQPNFTVLAYVGIALFSLTTLFSLVTLPVEFNASSRAMAILQNENIVDAQELTGVKKVLTAAAMTYVAALLTSIAQLLYYILRVNGRRR